MLRQALKIKTAKKHGVKHLLEPCCFPLGDGIQGDHINHQSLMDIQINTVTIDKSGVIILDLCCRVMNVNLLIRADACITIGICVLRPKRR